MALPFNTFSNEVVPDGTIRPTYDTYFQDSVNDVPRNTRKGVFGGGCVKVKTNGQGTQVVFSKTPIGGWSIMADDINCNDCINTKGNCSLRYFHSTPEKLTDEIATNCAGGSSLGYDELLRYDDGGVDTSCSIVTEDRFRSPGIPSKFFKNTSINKTQGGVHYPTLCQMGDYVSTVSECETQCEGISPNPDGVGDNYCHFAKNRLCGKLKGDPIKKNSTGSDIIDSDKDWITDQMCVDYCGGPDAKDTDPTCLEKKNKYCASNPDDWYSTTAIEGLNMTKAKYCKTFWKQNFNNGFARDACEAKLTQFDKEVNIRSNNGCGKLCHGKDKVNENFCQEMKKEFCKIHGRGSAATADNREFCSTKTIEEEIDFTNPIYYIFVIVPIVSLMVLAYGYRHMKRNSSKQKQMLLPLLVGGGNKGYDQFITFLNSLLYDRCHLKP